MRMIVMLLVAGVMIASSEGLASQSGSHGVEDGWFKTSDGVRLHYLVGGSGTTIVFVPGWTMPAEIWQSQLRHFISQSRVVALAPRSQGRSDRPSEGHFVERRAMDIHELLVHLDAHIRGRAGPLRVLEYSLQGLPIGGTREEAKVCPPPTPSSPL